LKEAGFFHNFFLYKNSHCRDWLVLPRLGQSTLRIASYHWIYTFYFLSWKQLQNLTTNGLHLSGTKWRNQVKANESLWSAVQACHGFIFPRDWLRDLFSYHFAMKITNKLFNVTCIDEQNVFDWPMFKWSHLSNSRFRSLIFEGYWNPFSFYPAGQRARCSFAAQKQNKQALLGLIAFVSPD